MNILIRLLAPAALLGAFLLFGERPSNPPDELPAAEMSAAPAEQALRSIPCPGIVSEALFVSSPSVRLKPAAAACLKADAPAPEARSHSPPTAA